MAGKLSCGLFSIYFNGLKDENVWFVESYVSRY